LKVKFATAKAFIYEIYLFNNSFVNTKMYPATRCQKNNKAINQKPEIIKTMKRAGKTLSVMV